MQNNDAAKRKGWWIIHDARAVMAVLGRLIAGSILTVMFDQYFSAQGTGAAFVKSRIWWEVVLNLQLLSVGMIWFSYSDRVTHIPGQLRRLQMTRRWMAIFAVSTPTLIALIGVFRDWFIVRPGSHVFIIVVIFAAIHLFVSLRIYKKIEEYRVGEKHEYSRMQRLVYFSPTMMFAIFIIVDVLRGGLTWFILFPLMVFVQGAMPYVFEAVGLKKPENYS